MKDRDRQWHDELSDLVAEEATEHLSRLRGSLAAKRSARKQKEEERQRKQDELLRLEAEKLEAKRQRKAVDELHHKYRGLATLPTAWVFALAALINSGIALSDSENWWMLWVSLGFALVSAKKFGDHARAKTLLAHFGTPELEARALAQAEVPTSKGKRAEQPVRPPVAAAALPVDPLEQRIDDACRRLETALAQSPQQVRDFLSTHPKRTIDELRATSKDFQQRERALRALSAPEARTRIQADHDALQSRIDKATDEGVRSSLFHARAALQQKQAHLDELLRSADRLEAERMRLSYTLEGLLAQLLRIQYSDGALAASDELPVGLRDGLEKLHGELSALAEASEVVGRIEEASHFAPLGDLGLDVESTESEGTRTRERS